MIAFRDNRQLERGHFRNLLDTQYKKVLLDKWKAEVIYNQRVLFGLAKEFHHLEYYDKELWLLIADTAVHKKKINNTHYWGIVFETLTDLNQDGPLKGLFTDHLAKLVEKHYTVDRKWRYNIEDGGSMRPLQELIDRREDAKWEDSLIKRAAVDEKIIEQAREAERKLKRLKMAKYSTDLFDEIIEEMMRDKKTIMEMMAELDVDESNIYAAQTRIAKRQQAKTIDELQTKG